MAKNPSSYYIKLAQKNKMRVYAGSKHWKIESYDPATGNRSVIMIPHELKGTGTEHTIRKWFLRMGVLLSLLALLIYLIPS